MMSMTPYDIGAEAHNRMDERLAAPRRTTELTGVPRPRRRHALAEQFRRIADAIDG